MRGLMFLLVAVLAAGPVQAQSDEACIAYMEADVEYEAAVNGDQDVGKSAWAYILANNALNSARKDSENRRTEVQIAYDLHEASVLSG